MYLQVYSWKSKYYENVGDTNTKSLQYLQLLQEFDVSDLRIESE